MSFSGDSQRPPNVGYCFDIVSSRPEQETQRHAFRACRFSDLGKETPLLLPHVIREELDKIAEEKTAPELLRGSAYEVLLTAQEGIVTQGTVAIALRPDIGLWKYVTVNPADMKIQGIETSKYLEMKENLSGQRALPYPPLNSMSVPCLVLECWTHILQNFS